MMLNPLRLAIAIATLAGALLLPRVGMAQEEPQLEQKRDSLFADYVARQKRLGEVPEERTPCEVWAALLASQRGVFLTLTHRLQIAKIRSDPLLQHMTGLVSIRGSNGNACDGGESNRLFLVMDATARSSLVLAREKQGDKTGRDAEEQAKADPVIRDFGQLASTQSLEQRRWRDSGDFLGPHAPFPASVESERGRAQNPDGAPRAQLHFFGCTPEQEERERAQCQPVSLQGRKNDDLASVASHELPFILEMDHDYNFLHHSSTECTYGDDTAETGRARYQRNYGMPGNPGVPPGVVPIDFDWEPSCQEEEMCQPTGCGDLADPCQACCGNSPCDGICTGSPLFCDRFS